MSTTTTNIRTVVSDNEQWVGERHTCGEGDGGTCLLCATGRAVAEAGDLEPPREAGRVRLARAVEDAQRRDTALMVAMALAALVACVLLGIAAMWMSGL